MELQIAPLPAGLYFVATPIGAARDITLRALDVLASADVLVAEDTRTLKHLLQIHGIALGERPVLSYHEHSGQAERDRVIGLISEGKSVAYASEAGTPLVADPGYQLCRSAIGASVPVTAAPGPSALLAALTVSGLPTDRFLFAGFAPTAAGARGQWLSELAGIRATLVIYESPKRVRGLLTSLVKHLGGTRRAVVCRELTKRFEEVSRGTLAELEAAFAGRNVKGEVVVLVDRAPKRPVDEDEMRGALRDALTRLTVKDAVAEVVAATGLPRRTVYQAALAMERADED